MSISSSGASSAQGSPDDRASPGLQPLKINFGPREETPPPFSVPMGDAVKANRDREEGSSSTTAEGNSVLIRFLDSNRPDLADYERLHPLRLEDLPPSTDIANNALNSQQPDPPSSTDIANNALQLLFQKNCQSPSPPSSSECLLKQAPSILPKSATKKPPDEPPQPLLLPEHDFRHLPPIRLALQGLNDATTGSYRCHHPGCTAPAFETQYLLNSHTTIHSGDRPYYCPMKGCPRSIGGKGFKRKNEMIRHGLVHGSPGYNCPFCSDQTRKYPRPDNLQRHVRIHHVGVDPDHPLLRQALAQRPERGRLRRRRGVEHNGKPDVLAEPCLDIVDSLLLAWTTLGRNEVSVPVSLVQD